MAARLDASRGPVDDWPWLMREGEDPETPAPIAAPSRPASSTDSRLNDAVSPLSVAPGSTLHPRGP